MQKMKFFLKKKMSEKNCQRSLKNAKKNLKKQKKFPPLLSLAIFLHPFFGA